MNQEKRRKRAKLKATANRRFRHGSPKGTEVQSRVGANKDHGCPYTGKDRFGGMLNKFADRFLAGEGSGDEGVSGFCYCYQNNKYTEEDL